MKFMHALKCFFRTVLLFSFLVQCVHAWDGHFLITYSALDKTSNISKIPNVPAETLETFLIKERNGLKKILAKSEAWSRRHLQHYPVLPSRLNFNNPDDTTPIQVQFLKAIRVNPVMKFPLFVQYPSGKIHRIAKQPIDVAHVVIPELSDGSALKFSSLPLENVSSGELLSPLEILTTASDEPDYGMDVNVWENNKTWFGKRYGMGEQPFGNHTIVFSSQTPFHMGFYFESNLIYKMAPFIQRTYPEYRIHQYLTLSQYAFSTGHSYWGYRFLGWALHYAQDLTQPYHSTLSPNHSTLKLLYVSALKLIGIRTPEQHLVQLLTNRHSSLENYVYYYLNNLFEKKDKSNSTLLAIADMDNDNNYPAYSDDYPREVIARESNQFGTKIDEVIQTVFPKKYVVDENYIFYETERSVNIFNVIKEREDLEALNGNLNELLRHAGSHTRNMVKFALTVVHP